jgi:hypothetical protein
VVARARDGVSARAWLGKGADMTQRLYLILYRPGKGRRIDGRGQWPSMAMGRRRFQEKSKEGPCLEGKQKEMKRESEAGASIAP